MKKRFIKKIIILISLTISITILLSTTLPVYAYTLTGYKWSTNSATYYYDNYNSSRGKTYFKAGANAWNSTDFTFSIGSYDTRNIFCSETYNSNVGWDGISSYTANGNYYTSITMLINTYYDITWSNDGALKSVIVHEFGHCLGLGENAKTKTVMNAYTWGTNSRYGGYGITSPQTDDKAGANALY